MTASNHMHTQPSDNEMPNPFEIRRALLESRCADSTKAAFDEFKRRNGKERHHSTAKKISISVLLAAACFIGILFALRWTKAEDTPQNDQLAKLGNVVYEAQPQRKYICIDTGGKTIELDPASKNQKDGIILTDNNEIQVFNVPSDNHDITTLSVPQGQQAKIMLDDGTVVWMNADSRLTFPRHFHDKGTREVELVGEAYFEVTHDEERPFIVNCNDVKTTVLGTKFNIHYYKGEKPIVTLVSGKVSVTHDKQEALLYPEQTVSFTENGEDMDITTADLDVVTSWMNGTFYFDGQTLQEILSEIGRWYNTNIVFSSDKHLNEKLHFNTERSHSLKDIIKQLQMICTAKMRLTDKALIVD